MQATKLITIVPLVLSACVDGKAGPDYDPPLATINGVIRASTVQTLPEVQVALVWHVFKEQALLLTAQELTVRAEFPAQFHLDLQDVPPLEAMRPLILFSLSTFTPVAGVTFADGILVVYEDTNGNGRLDVIPLNDPLAQPADRVLGVSENVIVDYLEGTPTVPLPPGKSVGPPGFGLSRFSVLENLGVWVTKLPISTEIEIDLTADPRLNRYVCQQGLPDGSICLSANCYPPPGAEVTCSADGLQYQWTLCSQPPPFCGNYPVCNSGGGSRPDGPAPSGWPCP